MAGLRYILGYEVLATLGHGARSTIYAVKDEKNHQVYALKRVMRETARDQRFLDQAINEHEIAVQVDHPNIRRSFKVIRQRKIIRTSEIFVLMEFVDGQTLEQHQPASFIELCEICQKVATGLDAMHEAGYVHADIKPNNIMITDSDSVKVIDLGQSCKIGTIKQRIQGTPDYIAPEQVRRRQITPRTDVFNLGATMYWATTRRHVPTLIPKGQVGVDLKQEITCPPPIDVNDQVPPALSTLIMDCIKTRASDRPATMELVEERLDFAISQLKRRQRDESGISQAVERQPL